METAYPAPAPAPQVFIIKENSASTKDLEDSKSAEALDDLSESFENAFTKALKSEQRKGRLHGKPRRGRVSQKQRERENLDVEDETSENEEKEDNEEKVQTYGGSRRDFGDDDDREETDNKEDTDINQQNDNDTADSDDNDDDDGNDIDDDDDEDNDDDIKADREPPYDLDQPRYPHSPPYYEENEHNDASRHKEKDRSGKSNKYFAFQRYGKNEDFHDERADRVYHSYGPFKNAFSNRYVKHWGFRQHNVRDKRPTLKTTDQEGVSQENDFYSFHVQSVQKVPSVAPSLSQRRHERKHKALNSQKRRLKFHHYPKDQSQLTTSHDLSAFTHFQDKASVKTGRMHASDHHSRHEKHHGHQKNNLKTEMIPENEISEDAGSTGEENDYSGDDKRIAGQKSTEMLSSSGNEDKSKSHRSEENTYVEDENKTPFSTVQYFKPGFHQKINKHKKLKSVKNIVMEASYSSGEESGEKDTNDNNGDEYY